MTATTSQTPGDAGRPDAAVPLPAFREIYAAQAGFVYNTLRRLGVYERDLEDKVQDVFVVAYRRLGTFDSSRPIRPWLGGIAAKVAADHRRLGRVKNELLERTPGGLDQRPHPSAPLQQMEARNLVLEALEPLPMEQRTVLVLHEIEGLSMPELAQALDQPLNTMYSRLRLARQRFTAAVRQLQHEGEPS